MIFALILFLIALAVGLLSQVTIAIVLPIAATALIVVTWLARRTFGFFEFLVLVGHLLAFHSGYLLGVYLAYLRIRPPMQSAAQRRDDKEPQVKARGRGTDRLQ